ncbi:unnamed protein product [marine sediment metagenome]|uniref:Uncharacterized protein n=1 Tax=marine sediment metagenome TaxID=412755 RepID=X1EMN6_9ZZZZ
MLDFFVPIIISVLALIISFYREFTGSDISLLNEEPAFVLTDESFARSSSEDYIPRFFYLNEVTLVFVNYGRKGGSILEVEFDFTPTKAFSEFFEDFSVDTYLRVIKCDMTNEDTNNTN